MAFSEIEQHRYEKPVKDYLAKRRPPPHIRKELDFGYRFRNQSVEIFEVRPMWRNPNEYLEHAVAKATFVRKTNRWKIYWQRADLKWHRYEPNPFTLTIDEFLSIVDRDEYGCFYG
jgi:hypothetical protein